VKYKAEVTIEGPRMSLEGDFEFDADPAASIDVLKRQVTEVVWFQIREDHTTKVEIKEKS
jgi:hypothetical protein